MKFFLVLLLFCSISAACDKALYIELNNKTDMHAVVEIDIEKRHGFRQVLKSLSQYSATGVGEAPDSYKASVYEFIVRENDTLFGWRNEDGMDIYGGKGKLIACGVYSRQDSHFLSSKPHVLVTISKRDGEVVLDSDSRCK